MKLNSLSLAFLLQLIASTCLANIYSFTGENYHSVNGAYTTSMNVSGTLTTSSPIPPNSTNFDLTTIVTGFSFTDGLQTIDSGNGDFSHDVSTPPLVSTDSAGNIITASFIVFNPSPAIVGPINYIVFAPHFPIGIDTDSYRNANCTLVGFGSCLAVVSGTDQAFSSSPGTVWARTPTYSVGGMVTGLTGDGLVLQNNGSDDLPVNADGSFEFVTAWADGCSYVVTVLTQPTGQTCAVSDGSGAIAGADVTSVSVACADNQYTLGGLLTGLVPGDTVVLQNNGGNDLTLFSDGAFQFGTPLIVNDPYSVTVLTQPPSPSNK